MNYLFLAARRWQHLARKFERAEALARDYRQTHAELRYDREAVIVKFENLNSILGDLDHDSSSLQNAYLNIWENDYRPHLLTYNLNKFKKLNGIYAEQRSLLKKALANFTMSEKLAEPTELALAEKTFPQRLITPSMIETTSDVEKIFRWWDRQWRYRVKLIVKNKTRRIDYPVEVHLNFSKLIEEARSLRPEDNIPVEDFDINSIRVIEHGAGGQPLTEIPSQFDRRPNFNTRYNADGNLVWSIAGELPEKSIRYYCVYFDTVAEKKKPKKPPEYKSQGLRTKPAGRGNFRISNKYLDIVLNRRGGTITQWEIEKADDLDIIDYNKKRPRAFLELPDYQDTVFNLTCEAKGPLMVRYRATAPNGFYKLITFYPDLPVCEVMMNVATYQCHNYSLEKKLRQPLPKFLFSNYLIGSIPDRKKTRITTTDTDWSLRTRRDGVTIACLTPDNKTTHYVRLDNEKKDGGFIGSVGLRQTQTPITHFLVFADVIKQDVFYLMNRLNTNFTTIDQPTVERNLVEIKPE